MATVESTELGLRVDGRSGWYKVVFTDASDLTIMENGTGFTLTGDQAGSKSVSMVKIPRVETRNSKAVVCGEFTLNNGEWFEWEEILTATGLAGALFSSETTATESAAFTGVSVVNRSSAGSDGNPLPNLRRTRFIRGAVPSSFTIAPTLTLDADAETGTDGATIAVTDQVSGLTTKFNNLSGGTNAFTFRKDYYGTGRNTIELVSGEAIRNTDAIDTSGGVTYHFVMESDCDSVDGNQDTFGEFYDGGGGLVADGHRRMFIRISGGAASTPSRGDTRYSLVKGAIQLYTLVVYANGDRVLYVDGRPYCSEAGSVPGASVTNKEWIRRKSGTGELRIRRLDIIEGELTEAEVYADQDYYANVIYANDEDLCGSLACFLSEDGSPTGTGRFNDPISEFSSTALGPTSYGKWNAGDKKDASFLIMAGHVIPQTDGITFNGSNEDPTYPWNIGTYGTPSPSSPIGILDYVDPDNGSGDGSILGVASSTSGDEFCLNSIEYRSSNRNFRTGGTADFADDLITDVGLFSPITGHKGLRFVNFVFSNLSYILKDNAGSLSDQDFSYSNLECWRLAPRNNYVTDSTQGTAGSTATFTWFLANRENTFMSDIIGYECGWDPDVINSTADQNLWGGATFNGDATNQPALDNGYSRFGYFSSTYGCVSVNNFINIRDASHDIQFREGGMLKDFIRWESEGTTFWADHDSYGENLYAEGSRGITGGNLIGYRGQQFSMSDATRLLVLKNVLANNAESTTNFPAFSFNADRTSASTYSPTGTANLRVNNIAAVGFNTGIQFGTNAALLGSVTRSLVDLTGAPTPSLVVDFNNTGSMAGFDITDLGYDLDSATASTAWDYNGTAGTLASLRSSTSMGITPVIDFTSTGLGFDGRTLIDYCTTVLGFTKVDGAQTNAEELGDQWYEAFADAMRQGGDVSPYYASKAIQWVFAGMQVDSAAQALIEAQDTGAIWGVQASITPTLSSSIPANNSNVTNALTSILFVFDTGIQFGTGTATISGGTTPATFVPSDGVINAENKTRYTISVDLTSAANDQVITIPAGFFTSISGNLPNEEFTLTLKTTRRVSTSAGAWGVTASFTDIPKFIKNSKDVDGVILTDRGWEKRLDGSNIDKGMMEVIVAGRFGIKAAENQVPVIFEKYNPLTRTLSGISGAPIDPYVIEVNDPDKILGPDTVSVGTTEGLPSGLSVRKASIDSPIELFTIVGIPDASGSGEATIQFLDENGGTVSATITYNIG